MSNSTKNKRIAKNTIFLYIRQIFVLLVSLYTTRVVLNVLGVEDYGIYNVVAGFVSMLTFLNTSISNGIQRFYNYERTTGGSTAANAVYNNALIIQLILSAAIILLAETVGYWYLCNKLEIPLDRLYAAKWVYHLSVISLVIVIMTVPYTAAVMSHEKMSYFAFVSIIDAVVKLVFVVLLNYITYDKLIVYGFLQVIISLLSLLLYTLYSKRHFEEISIKLVIDKSLLKKMFGFSGWNLLGTFSYTVKDQGLNLLLNVFFGPVVNAARGVSFQISNAIRSFTYNIFTASRPQIVESYAQKDYSRATQLVFSISKFGFYLLYMFAIPVILEIDYILSLWLKNDIPDYTAPFTVLVIFISLIEALNSPITMLIHASGKIKLYQVVTCLIITSTLPVSYLFLSNGASPLYVYWVSIIIVAINLFGSLLVLKRIYEFKIIEYFGRVLLPVVMVLIVAPILPTIIKYSMDNSFLRVVYVCATSCISLAICSYLIGTNKNEKLLAKSILKKIKR